MRLTGLELMRGDQVPRWYGRAYWSINTDEAVFYPIPINLVVRWARAVAWWVVMGKQSALEKAYRDGWEKGRLEVRREIVGQFQRLQIGAAEKQASAEVGE